MQTYPYFTAAPRTPIHGKNPHTPAVYDLRQTRRHLLLFGTRRIVLLRNDSLPRASSPTVQEDTYTRGYLSKTHTRTCTRTNTCKSTAFRLPHQLRHQRYPEKKPRFRYRAQSETSTACAPTVAWTFVTTDTNQAITTAVLGPQAAAYSTATHLKTRQVCHKKVPFGRTHAHANQYPPTLPGSLALSFTLHLEHDIHLIWDLEYQLYIGLDISSTRDISSIWGIRTPGAYPVWISTTHIDIPKGLNISNGFLRRTLTSRMDVSQQYKTML